ncbi:hypothetical protein GPJ56_003083 [Histomonas meleagridis]|uniref:uncharacterized protein n=1 Tax=Histomonas meleagridis TaxID=135588 RepID=UPI00355A1DEA|nr:hypothetical protein GPJ56_003083 [Histomonas meleagridis]KAH0805144.1 hypothetical protein GO595_002089 [Histomonas meleagridis]
MAVVIKYNGRNNRELLSAILDYCRMMFSYYFVPLPDSREENLNQMTADPKILVAIPHAFESILATINWNRISLDTYIFNSYQRQPMDGDPSEIQDFCQRVLNLKIEQNGKELNEFDSITILCQKKVVYSSLDPTSVRAVAFGLRRKFTHLFLHNPKTTYQSLTWLIGMYINSEGRHSFFQQPIYYDKKPHSIIAFKYQKYKIFITQPMDIEVSDKYFLSIPRKLARIQQYLKERYPRYIENNIPIPFAIAKNSRKDQIMVLDSFQIDAVLRVLVDANFVLAHQHTLHYDDNFAEIAFPSSSGLFVNSINDNNEETELILMMKVSARNISEYLKICKLIKKRKENVQEKHCSLL